MSCFGSGNDRRSKVSCVERPTETASKSIPKEGVRGSPADSHIFGYRQMLKELGQTAPVLDGNWHALSTCGCCAGIAPPKGKSRKQKGERIGYRRRELEDGRW